MQIILLIIFIEIAYLYEMYQLSIQIIFNFRNLFKSAFLHEIKGF